MSINPNLSVSLVLQSMANSIDEHLGAVAGKECAFVLMVHLDGVTQYTSNCSRQDGTKLIESLLARWRANRADIPAHYNPDLPRT